MKPPKLYLSKAAIDAALKHGVAVIVNGNPYWMGFVLEVAEQLKESQWPESK